MFTEADLEEAVEEVLGVISGGTVELAGSRGGIEVLGCISGGMEDVDFAGGGGGWLGGGGGG